MSRQRWVTAICVVALVALFALPLWLDARRGGDGERFGGTDSQAAEAVDAADPGYKPWFSPVFEPSGGEVESGLFAMQAALGAGVLGYAVGHMRGRRKGRDEALASPADLPTVDVPSHGVPSGPAAGETRP